MWIRTLFHQLVILEFQNITVSMAAYLLGNKKMHSQPWYDM